MVTVRGVITQQCLTGFLVLWMMSQVNSDSDCIRRRCDEKMINCSHSLIILVTDVTNGNLVRDRGAFENTKRVCMGRNWCDTSRVCGDTKKRQSLVVHYFCVNASHIHSRECSTNSTKVSAQSGFLQSPGYPGRTHYNNSQHCIWRIEAPQGNVMVLSLHDIHTSGDRSKCDGGLKVSCEEKGRWYAPFMLCGEAESPLNLMRCEKVDIELYPSAQVFPMRFWLSFHASPRDPYQPSNFQASLLPCSGWIYSMETRMRERFSNTDMGTLGTTTGAVMTNQENNTEVLVVMLSVISGFSAVLLVILIVVCVRCRVLQSSSSSEYTYSDPSAGLQAHNQYILSLESEKPRPQLADGYYEVADAIPPSQRGGTPTSPAYAEVESFVNLRKGPWSSSEEGAKCPKQPGGNGQQEDGSRSSVDDLRKDIVKVNGRLKPRGVSGLKTTERNDPQAKQKNSLTESRKSAGPTIIVPVLKKTSITENPVQPPQHGEADDDGYSAYEPIGEFSPVKPTNTVASPPVPKNHPSERKMSKPQSGATLITDNCSKTLDRIPGRNKFTQDRTNNSQLTPTKGCIPPGGNSGDLEQFSMRKTSVSAQTKTTASNFQEGSRTLPSKNSQLKIQALKNNNYKYTEYTEVPQSKGIVRNGIKMFEQRTVP
ncbi:unnamed protein product [Lymnaea stagnalis]|uniref:CUB domain-containing protein n=1 Tax=Lymnaea stagnalis TaxID=6523 RepID=A0AAV2HHZ5_LYMST